MELPKDPSPILTDVSHQNIFIYGEPKVGKTTLASQLPDAFFICTESGHNHVSIRKIEVSTWQEVYKIGELLRAKPDYCKTVVIDIVDNFYSLCESYVCKANGISDPSDMAFGKGFKAVQKEFNKICNAFNSMGLKLCFISHNKEREFKKTSSTWTRMGSSLSPTVELLVYGRCDIVLYCHVNEDNQRVMRTKGNKYVMAGDRSGKLPEVMPMDMSKLIKALSDSAKKEVKK